MDGLQARTLIEQALLPPRAGSAENPCLTEAKEEIALLKAGRGSGTRLLSWMAELVGEDAKSEVLELARRCVQDFPNSAISYQTVRLLLTSESEELETYALCMLLEERPISDLRVTIDQLTQIRHSDLFRAVIPSVLEHYRGQASFRRCDDGRLEFESIFDFVKFADDNFSSEGWLYRGHANAEWLLVPNLFRQYLGTPPDQAGTHAVKIPLPDDTQDFARWLMTNDRLKDTAGGACYELVEALAIAQH